MRGTDGYESIRERYEKELTLGYAARRKGGIAWKQHCATIRNLERKMNLAIRKAIRNENTPKP